LKTKIVYVVVSDGADVYLQQARLSAWSCRHYNPDAEIIWAVDCETYAAVQSLDIKEIRDCVTSFRVSEFPAGVSGMERSRWIKTNLRSLIDGDFLFVDTDTVFAGDIRFVDSVSDDVAIVLDLHHEFPGHPFESGIRQHMRALFGCEVPDGVDYFNSGAVYAKDTPVAHDFFNRWHANWNAVKHKDRGMFDQQPLMMTVIERPGVVACLDPRLNCQILGSVRWLYEGRILHFFNANWGRSSVHPFLQRETYLRLIGEPVLPEEYVDMVRNVKSLFAVPTMLIGPGDVEFWLSREAGALRRMRESPSRRRVLDALLFVVAKTGALRNAVKQLLGGVNDCCCDGYTNCRCAATMCVA